MLRLAWRLYCPWRRTGKSMMSWVLPKALCFGAVLATVACGAPDDPSEVTLPAEPTPEGRVAPAASSAPSTETTSDTDGASRQEEELGSSEQAASSAEPAAFVPTATNEAASEATPLDFGDEFAALRQVCVAQLNAYRATLDLAPLELAADVAECSDAGAELDATSGVAHTSASECPGMGAQNTCPGWDSSLFDSDEETLEACLDMMWREGEPPVSRVACAQDYAGCYGLHGHYLNMSNPANRYVSCGFYRTRDGKLWMNQDFGR